MKYLNTIVIVIITIELTKLPLFMTENHKDDSASKGVCAKEPTRKWYTFSGKFYFDHYSLHIAGI